MRIEDGEFEHKNDQEGPVFMREICLVYYTHSSYCLKLQTQRKESEQKEYRTVVHQAGG